MRTLYYVPVIHTPVDMGSFANSLKEDHIGRSGPRAWENYVQALEDMWDGLKQKIKDMGIPAPGLKLYQDGLPICGKEQEIVTSVALQGSQNYQILLELIRQGGTLMGTEDPKLLVAEYNHLKKVLRARSGFFGWAVLPFLKREGGRLLSQRDRFMARRIDETLKDGEAAICFIGIHHEVNELLPSDVNVIPVIHRLPFSVLTPFAARAGGW